MSDRTFLRKAGDWILRLSYGGRQSPANYLNPADSCFPTSASSPRPPTSFSAWPKRLFYVEANWNRTSSQSRNHWPLPYPGMMTSTIGVSMISSIYLDLHLTMQRTWSRTRKTQMRILIVLSLQTWSTATHFVIIGGCKTISSWNTLSFSSYLFYNTLLGSYFLRWLHCA